MQRCTLPEITNPVHGESGMAWNSQPTRTYEVKSSTSKRVSARKVMTLGAGCSRAAMQLHSKDDMHGQGELLFSAPVKPRPAYLGECTPVKGTTRMLGKEVNRLARRKAGLEPDT